MPGVRVDRNESAWLLPNDGTRANHRLRAGMRRFADTDEIDLVIVGCGAGGSVLMQRLARAGWRVAALDARPVLGPGRGLGQRRGGLAPAVLDRSAGDQRDRPGPDGLEQLRPRGRRLDGALRGLHPAFPPERLRHPQPGRGGRRLAAVATRSCARTTSRSSRNCRSRGSAGRGVTRTATRTGRTRSAGTARSSCAAPGRWASRPGWGRSRSPTAGSATGRTASTGASACRAARSTRKPRR